MWILKNNGWWVEAKCKSLQKFHNPMWHFARVQKIDIEKAALGNFRDPFYSFFLSSSTFFKLKLKCMYLATFHIFPAYSFALFHLHIPGFLPLNLQKAMANFMYLYCYAQEKSILWHSTSSVLKLME